MGNWAPCSRVSDSAPSIGMVLAIALAVQNVSTFWYHRQGGHCSTYLFQADNAQALSVFLSRPKHIRHICLLGELSILRQQAIILCSTNTGNSLTMPFMIGSALPGIPWQVMESQVALHCIALLFSAGTNFVYC